MTTKDYYKNYNEYSATLIKRLRKEANMSMDELASKSHLSKATISRYEKTGISHVPLSKAQNIAEALGVSVAYLCGYESRDLPFDYYHSVMPLIDEFGYELKYEYATESFSLNSEASTIPITVEQLKELKDSTYSFFKFKLSEIISNQSTTD